VPLGAEDVQPAHGYHVIVFGPALFRELIIKRLPLIERHLKNLAFLLDEHHPRFARLHRPVLLFRTLMPRRAPRSPANTVLQVCFSGNIRGSSPQGCRRVKCPSHGRPCSLRQSLHLCDPPARLLLPRARAAWRSIPGEGCPTSSATPRFVPTSRLRC